MINDAVPEDVGWVVLVEAGKVSRWEGQDDHAWHLATTRRADSRSAAEALAEQTAREYVPPEVDLSRGARAGRKVYRVPDGSWLVEVRGENNSRGLCRITVAALVYQETYRPAPQEPAAGVSWGLGV
ncbi:hypothetical protein [Streptomyces sp. NPDC002082]|uniref:hypothetical protein n=1 Tax=Streptomyces sp. NPDC002082 TaxID=3154772 RepID=UPI003318BB94